MDGRPRVLYADDEEDVREVFAAVFADDLDVAEGPGGQDVVGGGAACGVLCRRGHRQGEREAERQGSRELRYP